MSKEFLRKLGLIVIILYFVIAAYGAYKNSYDDSDDIANGVRSGLTIYTDHLTGCQYLGTLFGQITPRTDGHGIHIGCK